MARALKSEMTKPILSEIEAMPMGLGKDELLMRIAKTIYDTLIHGGIEVYMVALYLLDSTKQYVELQAAAGKGTPESVKAGEKLGVSVGWELTSARTGEIIIMDWEVGEVGEWYSYRLPYDATKVILVSRGCGVFFSPYFPYSHWDLHLPLRVQGQTVGSLVIYITETLKYDLDAVKAFQLLADKVTVHIGRAL